MIYCSTFLQKVIAKKWNFIAYNTLVLIDIFYVI